MVSVFPFHTSAMKANLLGAVALIIGASVLSACAEQRIIPATATTPAPMTAPVTSLQKSAPPANTAWIDMPATPGDWVWSVEGGQSTARFAGSKLTLRCNPASRTVQIERRENGSSPSNPSTLTVRTQTTSQTLSASPQAGGVIANLAARDPLLDAIAFSRGRFAIETPNWPTLYVPSWAEVSRVIEDCR